MATWIAHLRIAENILNRGFKFDKAAFVVGNIGPDAGMPNEDWSEFTPPPGVTHWKKDKEIMAEDFWNRYLQDGKVRDNTDVYSFYMGYYVHLITDIEWSRAMEEKKKDPRYYEGLLKDPKFIWIIKKDWYGLDFLYLDKHPDCIFHTCFKHIKEVPDYLDYFPPRAFEEKVRYIRDYYLGVNEETRENFIYLTEEEMDRFVNDATETIINMISERI